MAEILIHVDQGAGTVESFLAPAGEPSPDVNGNPFTQAPFEPLAARVKVNKYLTQGAANCIPCGTKQGGDKTIVFTLTAKRTLRNVRLEKPTTKNCEWRKTVTIPAVIPAVLATGDDFIVVIHVTVPQGVTTFDVRMTATGFL